jgi:hypothetical protein
MHDALGVTRPHLETPLHDFAKLQTREPRIQAKAVNLIRRAVHKRKLPRRNRHIVHLGVAAQVEFESKVRKKSIRL